MFASSFGSFTANSSSARGRGRGRKNTEWSRQQQYGQGYGQPLQYEAASSGDQQTRTSIKDLSPHQPNTVRHGVKR